MAERSLLAPLRDLIGAPLAVLRLGPRARRMLALYLLLAGGVLGVAAWQIVLHKGQAFDALLAYLFPEGWRFAAAELVRRFFAGQLRPILINATVAGSLFFVTLLLFRVKERLSRTFEDEARLVIQPMSEFPVWFQAWEELMLFSAFVAAQLSVFWLGYSPDPWRRDAARVASYAVLFASYGFNFISPILQRHRLRYGTIAKLLLARPLTLFGFGAIFSLPAVIVSRWSAHHPELSLAAELGVLCGVNALCIAWAAVAGTWVGARLLDVAVRTQRPSAGVRLLGWLLLLGTLAVNGWLFASVGASLHHKSQLLKCEWRIDPGTLQIKVAASGWTRFAVDLRARVHVRNPTAYDVVVEQNRLLVEHDGAELVRASISPLAVPAGSERTTDLALPIELRPEVFKRGLALFDTARWRLTLYLAITPDFELPIYLWPRKT